MEKYDNVQISDEQKLSNIMYIVHVGLHTSLHTHI